MNSDAGSVLVITTRNINAIGAVASAGVGARRPPTSAAIVTSSEVQVMYSAWQVARIQHAAPCLIHRTAACAR